MSERFHEEFNGTFQLPYDIEEIKENSVHSVGMRIWAHYVKQPAIKIISISAIDMRTVNQLLAIKFCCVYCTRFCFTSVCYAIHTMNKNAICTSSLSLSTFPFLTETIVKFYLRNEIVCVVPAAINIAITVLVISRT